MTNREWYLNKLNGMTNEELANYIEAEAVPWCKDNCSDNCPQCAKAWFDKEYIEPMPELKDGVFVEIDGQGLGVVLSGNVVLKNGLYGTITAGLKSEVSKVYDTVCFNLCDKSTCIWSKE